MIEKRYQVFVSSTFRDLIEERQEVTQALLELDCIPAGMELFPAANDDQWTLIRKVIDDCDYYLVIIGGKYGSIGPDGISYTEMEYRYAIDRKKPIIAFLHKNINKLPADRFETDGDLRLKLEAFRELAQKKLVRFWETPSDLGSVVSRSLIQFIKNNPAVGWVRGNNVTDESSAQEILRLRKEIDRLVGENKDRNLSASLQDQDLAQGEEEISLRCVISFRANDDAYYNKTRYGWRFRMTWNEIVAAVTPSMIDEANENTIKNRLEDAVSENQIEAVKEHESFAGGSNFAFDLDMKSFETCIVQLVALNVISKSSRTRSLKDKQTYWQLTPHGEKLMYTLRAIRSKASAEQGHNVDGDEDFITLSKH